MEIHILFFAAVLLVAHGARVTREAEVEATEDECKQPPENTELVSCCDIPTRHVLGHIKDTIHFCAKKMRENKEEPKMSTLPPPSDRKRHFFKHRFHNGMRKGEEISEKILKELANLTCFVQCLFEREGFLVNNNINKELLIERIRNSFGDYEEWQETVPNAVEKCLSSEIIVAANETCKSGSSEVFRCILKELYMQCPLWLEDNEYCNSLKNFYIKCPNGPPPEVFPKKKYRRNRPKNPESEPEEDIENPNQDM